MPSTDPWLTYERIQLSEPADLTDQERALRAVGDLRSEVNSGGFSAYFFSGAGDLAEVAVAAISDDVSDLADLLRRAMAVVATPYPKDIGERQRLIHGSDDVGDQLELLDHAYYQLEAGQDLDAAMARLCP